MGNLAVFCFINCVLLVLIVCDCICSKRITLVSAIVGALTFLMDVTVVAVLCCEAMEVI